MDIRRFENDITELEADKSEQKGQRADPNARSISDLIEQVEVGTNVFIINEKVVDFVKAFDFVNEDNRAKGAVIGEIKNQ